MIPEAQAILAALDFRLPGLLRLIEPLSPEQLLWQPPAEANQIAWQLWHIAEVEDNWVRELLFGQKRHFPFGRSVRDARVAEYPSKRELLLYLQEVRTLSRKRLADTQPEDFARLVQDPHFGQIAVRAIWGGVITSFAWHAGQIALTVRLLREASARDT